MIERLQKRMARTTIDVKGDKRKTKEREREMVFGIVHHKAK
jgi:hypothetical protein